jgi:hypothetical protein
MLSAAASVCAAEARERAVGISCSNPSRSIASCHWAKRSASLMFLGAAAVASDGGGSRWRRTGGEARLGQLALDSGAARREILAQLAAAPATDQRQSSSERSIAKPRCRNSAESCGLNAAPKALFQDRYLQPCRSRQTSRQSARKWRGCRHDDDAVQWRALCRRHASLALPRTYQRRSECAFLQHRICMSTMSQMGSGSWQYRDKIFGMTFL